MFLLLLAMAEWRELCLSEDVEELILTRLHGSELSHRMLAGVQRELVTRREAGPGRVGEVAADFIKSSGRLVAHEVNIVFAISFRVSSSTKELGIP